MVESLERKFEFPKTLENAFEVEAVWYIGRASDLHFEGTSILGRPHLAKYHNGILVPRFDISANYDHEQFIVNGKPSRSRIWGYRQELVYRLANLGINVGDELLNNVFGPIEDELTKLYLQIFPPEKEAEKEIKFISGEVKEAWSSEVGMIPRKATFYTIVDSDGIPHRVAIPGGQDKLQVGDRVALDFDQSDVMAQITEYSTIETLPGQFQVTPTRKKWLRVTGYSKRNEEET